MDFVPRSKRQGQFVPGLFRDILIDRLGKILVSDWITSFCNIGVEH